MRFIIYGAGGVGGVIGAQLFKHGKDVALIARGQHLAAMQSHGLRYQTPVGDEYLQIPAVAHPRDLTLGSDDVVVLTCKSQHTSSALDELRASHGSQVNVVCCQNGVANERMAIRRFANVYAMLVYLPAQLIEPGRIQCHSKLKHGVLDLGLFPGRVDSRCTQIAETFEQANFSIRPDADVMRLKYAKLLTNLNNALEAVAPGGAVAKTILQQMKQEGRDCLNAAGIPFASESEVKARRAGVFETGEITGVDRVGGSSRQSLLRGTGDIEADYLNGEITQLGRLHGIPTPANAVLQQLAVEAAARRDQPGSVSLEQVQRMIEAESTRLQPLCS